MCSTEILLVMIFNEIKCHVNTSSGLVGGCIPCIPPLCPHLPVDVFSSLTTTDLINTSRSYIRLHSAVTCGLVPPQFLSSFKHKGQYRILIVVSID